MCQCQGANARAAAFYVRLYIAPSPRDSVMRVLGVGALVIRK